MPYTALSPTDMLHLCCGICGLKKDPKQLRKITGHILSQIESIEGYEYYDLEDDGYPNVFFNLHCGTIYGLSREPPNSKSKLI